MPDDELLKKILQCFNINDLNDNKEFTKAYLIFYKTNFLLEELIPELVCIYLPCKYNQFLGELTINRSLTILRQIIKLYDYKLNKRALIHDKTKVIYYSIRPIETNIIKVDKNITIKF
tara:strand:+ start:1662 stop:2015 length:354 start_codon:yes stop_codon:yes gene_type:complete